jgi:hypothetical protein
MQKRKGREKSRTWRGRKSKKNIRAIKKSIGDR